MSLVESTHPNSQIDQSNGDIITVASCCGVAAEAPTGADDNFWPKVWLRVGIVLVIAGQGAVLSLGLNTAEPPLTPQNPIYWALHGGLLLSALIVLAILGGPLVRETAAALRQRKITVDSLFALSVVGALVGSIIASYRGEGSVYYEVVAIVLAIYTVGKALGVRTRARALAEAGKLENEFDFAWIDDDTACGGRRRVPLESVQLTDTLVIGPGEGIPVDGKVVRGKAYVQEQSLTGEPAAVVRTVGEPVLAGTHSVDGLLYIKPEKLKGERRFDGVLAAVREARDKPSSLQAEADRLTQWFVPVVTTVSLLTFFGWMPFIGWSSALFNAMAVLIVACPCALGLATPVAVWRGVASLARIGLVPRTGDLLDTLARTRTVVFDKTGTLSDESLSVAKVETMTGFKGKESMLAAGVGAIESAVNHPVAQALSQWANQQTNNAERPVIIDSRLEPGRGIIATIAFGKHPESIWRLGQASFALDQPDNDEDAVCLSIDGEPVARFFLAETLRPSADSALKELADDGIEMTVLTGDMKPRWAEIAGVHIESGLTPLEKVERVKELRHDKIPLLFIGDGINDAPAMAEADGAIAMDSGADLSRSSADGILIGGRLEALPQAVLLCRRIRKSIAHNIRFASVYNMIGMALAAGGVLHPVIAALLMLGSSAYVSVRVMRASV
ncbi:cation-translocating P-type ATPase [Rubellicoccus peritrichatus]|uniref:Cation-translocating P-type ATPase n=1 Tax=Rubellicoccus peritrichatus TaxID=3080537 RepID=A0AAQ3LGB8_9BACT|nr:cation-translocating P-type ATPase [Puniceicoccus sp. CR14]WOO43360.1 cation-translocating P-type ATPase [Puniceicoccus sp. CR14]